MFGLGTSELMIILLLVLVVFGAGKLSSIGGALGKGIKNFKEGVGEETETKPAPPKKKDEES
ncbi:MAG: twin-arginine translocase TatA/TatE family subunit [Desulfuromonadales bacterium]|nr:twin-arginine translocase TatA/TatE family subunit [Desulfuromonadales bacterium]